MEPDRGAKALKHTSRGAHAAVRVAVRSLLLPSIRETQIRFDKTNTKHNTSQTLTGPGARFTAHTQPQWGSSTAFTALPPYIC